MKTNLRVIKEEGKERKKEEREREREREKRDLMSV